MIFPENRRPPFGIMRWAILEPLAAMADDPAPVEQAARHGVAL